MQSQQNLFEDQPAPPPPPPVPFTEAVAPIWLQRMSLFVLVLFCVYIGVFVTYLPWSRTLWDHNLFLTSHPHLWAVLRLGPTRGVISGLGLLDIWVGISEAVNYHDHPRTPKV